MATMTVLAQRIAQAVRLVLRGARQNFEERGEVVPLGFIFGRKLPPGLEGLAAKKIGDDDDVLYMLVVPVIGPLQDPRIGKELTAEVLRTGAALVDAAAVMLVSESWTLTTLDGLEWVQSGKRVRDHPKAVEQVVVWVEAEEDGDATWTAVIERPQGGPPVLGEWKKAGDCVGGVFSGLLPGRTPGKGGRATNYV